MINVAFYINFSKMILFYLSSTDCLQYSVSIEVRKFSIFDAMKNEQIEQGPML
jgi:hypothetical protein